MHLLFALSIAVLAGCSLYLILSRHIVRVLLGVTMLSAAINLVIFFAGRIVTNMPAVIRAGESSLPADAANPLPQALVLTAIVRFSVLGWQPACGKVVAPSVWSAPCA